jgi:AraC family transcriptional regulator, transcriptional activator of pobA
MATTAIRRKGAGVAAQFRIAAIGEGKCTLESFSRRDFYKISLVTKGSPYSLRYGSLDEIKIDRPALILMNPVVPYAWSVPERTVETEGFFCVFNDEFIRSGAHLSGVAHRLFATQQSPVHFPDRAAEQFLTGLFARMRIEADMDYADKDDLFRSHLSLVFHEAAQMRRAENINDIGPGRVAARFIGLLNMQFPVDLPLQPISLKKASDFASRIAVHVNHLNTAVQKATGKSTTTIIGERLFAEAKSLLDHTDYSVSEIAFGLGFEYQSYFNRFFRKHAGVAPSEYRKNFEKYK